jgi:hypothetical protein
MIHHSVANPSCRVTRVIAATSGSLLAIIAGSLSNPASAGGSAVDLQPPLRGSYCGGSDQDLAPPVGCARISGYITAGDHFGFDERIGGRSDLFAPLAGARSSSGITIIGPPLGGDSFLPRATPGDTAR